MPMPMLRSFWYCIQVVSSIIDIASTVAWCAESALTRATRWFLCTLLYDYDSISVFAASFDLVVVLLAQSPLNDGWWLMKMVAFSISLLERMQDIYGRPLHHAPLQVLRVHVDKYLYTLTIESKMRSDFYKILMREKIRHLKHSKSMRQWYFCTNSPVHQPHTLHTHLEPR